jgi:hypothetical protein
MAARWRLTTMDIRGGDTDRIQQDILTSGLPMNLE